MVVLHRKLRCDTEHFGPWSCDPYHMLIVLCDIYYVTCNANGMCNGVFFTNKDYKKSCEQMSLFPLVLWAFVVEPLVAPYLLLLVLELQNNVNKIKWFSEDAWKVEASPSPGTEEGLARTVSMIWTRSSFLTLLIKISNLWYNIKVYYTFSVKSGMLSSNLVFTEAQNPLALDCVAASACMPAWSTHKHGADHAVCGPIISPHNILWSRKTTHNLCPNIEHEVDLT